MRKLSVDVMAAEEAAERTKPSLDAAHKLTQELEHANLQYTLMADDILIRGGRFADRRVSDIVRTVDGRDYLGQVWRQANPEVRRVLRRFFSE